MPYKNLRDTIQDIVESNERRDLQEVNKDTRSKGELKASDYNFSKKSKETLDESAWVSVAQFAAWTVMSGLAASIIAMINLVVTDGTLFDPIIEKWQDRVYGGKLSADGAKSFISDLEKMIPSLPKHKQKYMMDGIKKLKKIADTGNKTELGKQASHMGLQMNLKLHDMPNQNE